MPRPVITRVPNTKSLTDPDQGRRGPDNPQAIMPPTVAPSPKEGGSQGNICCASSSTFASSASGVPQRTVITSSVGS
ncbi:hypothetical protein D3C78_1579400 [compost metagenome]